MSAVTIPILPSAGFDVTVAFWGGLGFVETGRWPGEYLIVKHDAMGIDLHGNLVRVGGFPTEPRE